MMTTEQRGKLVAKMASNAKWSGLSMFVIIACLVGQYLLQGAQGVASAGFVVCWVVAALLIMNQARMLWESHRLKRRLNEDIKEHIRYLRRNERKIY